MFKFRDNLEYEFLPPAIEIEETPPSPIRRLLIWIIFVITVSVFVWSYFGEVDEVAVARGKVIPDGRVKVIQPLEAGVIKAIHVQEGQRVKKGQLLIELDPTIQQADAASSAKTLSIHKADRERLMEEMKTGEWHKANGEREKPLANVKAAKGEGQEKNNLSPQEKSIVELQNKLKEAREAEYAAKEYALRFVIEQRENTLRAAEAALVKLEKTTAITREQETSARTLYEQGYLSKTDLLNKQKELYSLEQEMEAQKSLTEQARNGIEEARKNLDALKKEREKSIFSDIVASEKSIASIEGEVVKANKRTDQEQLYSPVDGTVHGLASYTIGGVVTPAQPVVTIVPEGTPLIVEAMLLNSDIGFVKAGQEAEVKLDTFPFQKYGTVKGNVTWLSPDAVDDEKLGPVYKMKVAMERQSIKVHGKETLIAPGMTLSVEVKTGERRIIEFFLSPIVKYTKESLTLR
ncbi:MAG: HlyD family type I secretion periplasmic adaptor subunit [Deltaproteobacteria bacterium]|nr:HlyD family type I secretion periplasmic adaptor subunit [Deltaproteobacteria bacterium]